MNQKENHPKNTKEFDTQTSSFTKFHIQKVEYTRNDEIYIFSYQDHLYSNRRVG